MKQTQKWLYVQTQQSSQQPGPEVQQSVGGLHRLMPKVTPAHYSSSSPTLISKYVYVRLQNLKNGVTLYNGPSQTRGWCCGGFPLGWVLISMNFDINKNYDKTLKHRFSLENNFQFLCHNHNDKVQKHCIFILRWSGGACKHKETNNFNSEY